MSKFCHLNANCNNNDDRCGEGRSLSVDGKLCVDRNECLDGPCQNGGVCINKEPASRYRCVCPDNFWGDDCELVHEPQTMKLGLGALATILGCLLIILGECYLISLFRNQ